jgi:hypothetical protein
MTRLPSDILSVVNIVIHQIHPDEALPLITRVKAGEAEQLIELATTAARRTSLLRNAEKAVGACPNIRFAFSLSGPKPSNQSL